FSTAPHSTQIYTLSLHDALPISAPVRRPAAGGGADPRDEGVVRRADVGTAATGVRGPLGRVRRRRAPRRRRRAARGTARTGARLDRKSTRLNSSHSQISYAVFCL